MLEMLSSGCACLSLRKAARMMAQAYDHKLRPLELRNTQFSLLSLLAMNGSSTVSALADDLAMDRTTLTRNLGVMERRQLVAISVGNDARTRHVEITESGETLLHQAIPLWKEAQNSVEEKLGKSHWNDLRTELSGILKIAKELG